ncbi:hypothetical protein DCO58_01470 [Helicobacter saguini]|uniref:Uncharacterized protein n=1 Tax=Helicobacter saguini TaxID=1548018 RepID=A0A347VRD0_9HELI|nr:hypothetical protein [Helicobacter saguini]MWV62946.1 hypothetical protein [Helicobacter saguini]MWV66383.1 hypothetical protein [Helicobacter saguini]MWV68736.1 hypothetical protein [Helicobacter saguini]MWV71712.1 hypothetical protein [Helicobacter saguini]TLD92157.1 hypothetical protein LS64_010725 [Helicobacter saguini]
MKGAIFKYREIDIWNRIEEEAKNDTSKYNFKSQEDMRLHELNTIMQTLKSYRPSPNGNGMKWSKEEKAKFVKLSYKEQRKMIVRKSELKSSLFPYVNVDYKDYVYSDRISDTAKKAYDKATKILESKSKIDFNNLDSKIQQEILQNLRIAYNERYLKAGVELAKLLFKKSHLKGGDENKKDMYECNKIVKDLLSEKIGDISYLYYQLYKWCIDEDRLYNDLDIYDLGLVREVALECYNHALESIVWEAIDEEGQRRGIKGTIFAAELYLAAAIKYQSPLAFYMAGSNYGAQGVWTTAYALIPYHACIRCSIALGKTSGIEKLAKDYTQGLFMQHASRPRAVAMWDYAQKSASKRGLINGLDPYFDDKFPPDLMIDLSAQVQGCIYGGSIKMMGLVLAREQGLIKDPRDKDSTMESIKHYYLTMWQIVVTRTRTYTYRGINPYDILSDRIYSKLVYGLPSARPYIFPTEVLDLKIDFNKGF